MECTWDAALLARRDQLPPELLEIIQQGTHEQYLEALTRTALDARHTYLILAHCEDLLAHICASLRTYGSLAASIATLGRIVPFAPFLTPYATRLLEDEKYHLGSSDDENDDLAYLLGLFRLLRLNHRVFRKHVQTPELTRMLGRRSRPVTYLIIRILQICLHGADHWFESTCEKYLGADSPESEIAGSWDEKNIDFRFLSLWEEDRAEAVWAAIADTRHLNPTDSTPRRTIPYSCFSLSTALIGGVLLPRMQETTSQSDGQALVQTETVSENLKMVAQSLKSSNPVLLAGLPGSGKSMLVRHAARTLGKLDKMITLHLNEQSDAKLLLGLYTTGSSPGTFEWRPGVLTTAVREGRWVLIEDLDRAPNEVLGTLLPLIEKGELFIPNRKDTIYAADGFRIIATVRSSTNHRGEENKPLTHMLGSRHWQTVPISLPSAAEHSEIAKSLFPNLDKLLPQFLAVYERLTAVRQQSVLVGQSKTGVARAITPRELLKWCQRVSRLLRDRDTFTTTDMDKIYLEAIDCFIGSLPDDSARSTLTAAVAEELHIDPQRRDYLLTSRDAQYKADKENITVGRYTLRKARHVKISDSSFSTNPHTSRMLERVAAAVSNREPLLLVGETGVGKTTAVQHLANHLGRKLVPFNLSQQSEAGDLLGGFKPVNARMLIVPMKDEFDDLFSESFSASKNKQFIDLLGKQMAKSNWKAVCKLWRQALAMVDQQRAASPLPREGEAPSKKRRVDTKRAIDFAKWDIFASKVETMERQLANGDNAFAFTFVEGNIVKAVRNGDWVLLDEINLASPDTLEALVDLLDSNSPSLLLTEAGDIERIDAHPNFRVFAAMNPATDVGKKDLPPGIRSRFTEIYVEGPDKDLKSLCSIVTAYLRQESTADAALPSDVSTLYQKIIGFSEDNKLVDGAGQKPHFSLRTLTRTLSYAKTIQQMCSPRRALYEGFHMSFLTFLDAESSALLQPLIEQHLFGKRTNIQAELSRALRKPKDGESYVQGYPDSKDNRYQNTKHWIRQGSEERQDQTHYIITPFVRNNLENLVRATSTRQFPVLIQGPTSSGKTSMIEYLAKRTGHKFTRINNHEHTDLQEYLGTYVSGIDGRLQFQEGVLVKALREGHWIVLDELNLAPTDVLEALNRLLDDNRELLVPETQEVVRPHPDFMLFATQNPAGLYGGRKTLSRAFRNRFLELHFDDIPVDELEDILHRRTQLPRTWAKRIVTVYRELSLLRQENRLFEQKSFATLRDLFRWAMRPNDTIDQLATNGYMLLCERVRKQEERVALKAILEKAMSEKGPKVRVDEDSLYSESSAEIQQHLQNSTQKGVVWTSAMRRLYVLVSRAIQNNEPVLLVGETGCGKTTVCQMLADALRKDLHIVNAHQNTETGDLIGSQRPVRNRAGVETALRQNLLSSPILQETSDESHSTDELLTAYDRALVTARNDNNIAYIQSAAHSEIQSLRTSFKALFEWSDGSLVHAMRNGDFFLLDEISLADDSVLERINSVLESQRTILLAEKGSLDSSIVASDGFQFFATMNPGGDYGKRELSPALRNRFTEIWVPALSDLDDVLHIVRDKLVENAQPHAEAMVSFAAWFKNRFDTSASSSVSIRDTLAWVQFVNAFAALDVKSAVVHGAAMVYIDTLGANPAGLMSLSSQDIAAERTACLDELDTLLAVNTKEIYSQSLALHSDNAQFGIGPFNVARNSSSQATDLAFSFDPPTTRSNSMRVLRALQLSKPVMLEGSPGVGKTALVTAIAAAAGMPLTRINLSDQTDLLDLFGSDAPVEGAQTGTFVWRDAPFLRAMKKGEWVLLDEMNLAAQSVLEGLNACLDHRESVFVPELGQTFTRHPNFRLFAAQNPHHQGGGRKGLPASFVNRFTVVYADAFKPEDLMMICQRMFPGLDTDETKRAVAFVSKLDDEVTHKRRFGASGGPWEFNLRDIARWLSLASTDEALLQAGTSKDFVNSMFLQRFRTVHDRACVDELYTSVFGSAIPAADSFSSVSTQTMQVGIGLLPRHSSKSTPQRLQHVGSSHPQVLQTVMICVQQGWPVLLTGPSGSGKSSVIDRLAAGVGADLVTLAMNAETDALDLIGGYEQFDPHRETAQALKDLRTECYQMAKHGLLAGPDAEVADLLRAVNSLDSGSDSATLSRLAHMLSPEAVSKFQPLFERLQRSEATIDKAKFEWIDGPLIDALQLGKWLVLDNANLCSPSVLDRLNSLLEPNGALIINEHSAQDGSPLIIRPHPRFRIFLTVDPRLGELSRAMRNRAVELFMMSDINAASSTDGLYTESAMARFRAFKASPTAGEEEVKVAFDHLAQRDRPLVPRLLKQLNQGLFGCPVGSVPDLQPLAALVAGGSSLKPFYEETSSYMQVPADFACVQTFHPLNNQPLVRRSQQSYHQALSLAAQYDLNLSFKSVENTLASFKASRKRSDRLARSWKSIRQEIKAVGKKSATPLDLVNNLLQELGMALQQGLVSSLEQLSETKKTMQMMLAYCSTLLRALDSDTLDVAALTACVLAGHALYSTQVSGSSPILQSVTSQCQRLLSEFDPEASSGVGRTHVALWATLRPNVPATIDNLQANLSFEAVVDQFDNATASLRLPPAQVVDLRLAFQQALKLGSAAGLKLNELAEQAQASMPAAAITIEDGDTIPIPTVPHFANTFETLCQHFAILALSNITVRPAESVLMETLALRKTNASITLSNDESEQSPQSKLRLLGLSLPRSTNSTPNHASDRVECSILRSLASVERVCLDDMSRLEAETHALGQTIGSKAHLIQADSLPALNAALRDLFQAVLSSLIESDGSDDWSHCASHLLGCLTTGNEETALEQTHSIAVYESEPAECLKLVADFLRSDSTTSPQQASQAWLSFAIACIMLFVPSRAFDPVQEAHFRKTVHENAKEHVRSRLQALLSFREAWFGQRESLRSRLLEEEDIALGPGPEVVEICRPTDSQLMQLHGEFLNLLRLLQPARTLEASQLSPEVIDGHAWENLKVLRTRLESRQYRPYADLTTPVVGFIDCLFIAQRLHLQAIATQGKETESVQLARIMPMVGASSNDWMSDALFVEVQQTYRSREAQIYWLSAIAARSTALPVTKLSSDLQTAIDDTFCSFYEAWKIELSRDQKLNAANSSLYTYRGGDELEEEVSQEELDEIFPTWEAESGNRGDTAKPSTSAQSLAPKMAELYHSIYSDSQSNDQILALVNQWTAVSASQPHSEPGFATIFQGLDKLVTALKSHSAESRFINIYQHAHIDQSRILVALIRRIQQRFQTIHTVWPEHATPIEVLRACDLVLALGHSEPLARYFQPVEKLHATINEWQKIASSEFSASGLLDETTDLIISWRRLELSTWAGMFDSEDKQCTQNAASWWFIAYETIIRASDDPTTSAQGAEAFAQELLETLGSFLSGCGLGEYRVRLDMLRDFEAALATRSADNTTFSKVRSALASLISFYARFEGAVSEQLTKKRAGLEKDIKNVIQLASWKDRNIETLRQSAKASHKKLFRIVRKYRQALSESVGPILQAEFPYIKLAIESTDSAALWERILRLAEQADDIATASWDQSALPQDPVAAIQQMKTKSNSIRTSTTAAKRIDKFLQELEDETVELRKATPNLLTEENKTLVQHLKTRKRRLLADVLRDVRLMGFQTNISDSVLAQQHSLSIILAKAPPLTIFSQTSLDMADQEFHRLLHIMPSVRAGAIKHSEDLTPAEVARSKILIESMLQVSIEQRQMLARQLRGLKTFELGLKQIDTLAASDGVSIHEQTPSPQFQLRSRVLTLRQVVQCCSSCVEMQGRLCGSDYSKAVEKLNSSAQALETILTEADSHGSLPQHMSNASVDTSYSKYLEVSRDIKTTVLKETQAHPELAPLLSQLAGWTDENSHNLTLPDSESAMTTVAGTWLENLTSLTKHACESTVVQGEATANGQLKKMWLLEQQRALNSSIEGLRLGDIAQELELLLDTLHTVHPDGTADLSEVAAVCRNIVPLLRAYNTVADVLIRELSTLHATTSRMAHRLAMSFVQLASQGFCTPSDKAANDEQQSGKAESGTGLGEGEGAEDISKDIGDDEDLGDLAQDANSKEQKDETEAEKDAVDMADEDLEGDFDEDAGSEGEDGSDAEDGQSEADVDEEAGHVDEDDAEAKDEKTWNDKEEAGEAEKEAEGTKGTKSEDVSAAGENAKEGEEGGEEEQQEPDEEADAGAEMEQDLQHQEPEKADPHMNEEENLDLPDDINMDGNKDDVDDMSDVDSDLADDMEDFDGDDQTDARPEEKDVEMGDEEGSEQGEDNGEATTQDNEEEVQEQGDDATSDVAMLDNNQPEDEPAEGLVSADDGQGQEQDNKAQANGALAGDDQLENENDMNDPSTQSGTAKGGNKTEQDTSSGQAEPGAEEQQRQPYKQLGDVLKEWFNQNRDIEAAKEQEAPQDQPEEQPNLDDPRFEHTDDADVEMQALGAAKAEQSRALDDQNAMPIEQEEDETETAQPLKDEDEMALDQQLEDEGDGAGASGNAADSTEQNSKAMIGRPTDVDMEMDSAVEGTEEHDLEDVDEQLTNTHLSREEESLMSIEDARRAWSEHESRTRNMAVVLTEHLRLILQPTQATKMRGDFRTGKRLNIKKIIPYIASSYKRDKIWMRRSIPSKRSYQIMLAIDDSESMNESERKGLAFDTLALVAKSMAMLEVGELCIVGFGQTVNVNHDFSMPFTSDAGAEVFRHFSFAQSKTDVRRLLEQSIELFRAARLKASGSGSNLWQLQLIISDGLCEDHPSIRQLVRQAHEEQIMVVFIVVDATAQETTAAGPKQSIMDLQRAEFKDGDVKMIKYLDTFPFRYYLIVRDVLELPAVLAGALRQWFAEVVDTGN